MLSVLLLLLDIIRNYQLFPKFKEVTWTPSGVIYSSRPYHFARMKCIASPIWEIWLEPQNFKMGHVTLTTPIRGAGPNPSSQRGLKAELVYFICVFSSMSVAVWPFVAYLKWNEMKALHKTGSEAEPQVAEQICLSHSQRCPKFCTYFVHCILARVAAGPKLKGSAALFPQRWIWANFSKTNLSARYWTQPIQQPNQAMYHRCFDPTLPTILGNKTMLLCRSDIMWLAKNCTT